MTGDTGYRVEASHAGDVFSLPDALMFGVALAFFWAAYTALCALIWDGGISPKARCLRKLFLALRSAEKKLSPKKRHPKPQGQKRLTKIMGITLRAVLDTLWFLIAAAWSSVFFYRAHFGELRWYLFLMIGIGFFACSRTVGTYAVHVAAILFSIARHTVRLCLYAVWYAAAKPVLSLKASLKKRKRQPCPKQKKKKRGKRGENIEKA